MQGCTLVALGPRRVPLSYFGVMLRTQRCGTVLGVLVTSTVVVAPLIPAVSAASTGHLLQAQEARVTGPRAIIVGNFQGIFRTSDSGNHWIEITPPDIESQPILLSHLAKIVTVGKNHIWLVFVGDTRFDFIPYSSNGGATWISLKNTASVPSSTQEWRTTALLNRGSVPKGFRLRDWYLASPSRVWAQATGPHIGDFFPIYLLRSTNGGRTWTTVAI